MLALEESPTLSAEISYHVTVLNYICSGRRAYTTREGRIGLHPLEIRDGDHIYLFKEVVIPYVLWPALSQGVQGVASDLIFD